jgi:hypothetical protein
MTGGFDDTTVTFASIFSCVDMRTASASDREIFWMMDDLFRPVPAAGAPAFWTKKTSSLGGYLELPVTTIVGSRM